MYRPPAIGMKAMVSSGNALASIAGLRVMIDGGNAVDATIAINTVLHVTSPFVCGMGGDLFALVYDARTGNVHGFNGSGRTPAAMSIPYMRGLGHQTMPRAGGLPVTVPGCADGLAQLHERFGTLPWADLFKPAIDYARDGHPVGPDSARYFATGLRTNSHSVSWMRTFAPDGTTPIPGQVIRQPELAASLERVAAEGRDGFYLGELARRLVAQVRTDGGVMTEEDLADHRGEWSTPPATTYRGNTVYTTAPNSQGITALIALNLLEEIDLANSEWGSPGAIAYLAEATKLACADRDRYISDPAFTDIPTDWLLSKDRLRGALERGRQAPPVNLSSAGDTTSFCVVDPQGNAVSCIQSNYMDFGSGVVVGGFGLQNRGAYFSLDPGHVNRLDPRKRTLQTMMVTMVMAADKPWIVFGSVGGDIQPQTHLQVLTNVIDYKMNIQDAIESPRFVLGLGNEPGSLKPFRLESRFDAGVFEGLRTLGYEPEPAPSLPGRPGWSTGFGLGQGIVIDPAGGARFGGADPRWDAYAAGF
ncbi:MAG: gamma-glutamyltransferase [Dehalococcoidia bacterium]|nr:gamma-glutamyltransferase [Dehalococcoidia bacterium]